jgi:hypothetical protein
MLGDDAKVVLYLIVCVDGASGTLIRVDSLRLIWFIGLYSKALNYYYYYYYFVSNTRPILNKQD